MATTLLLFAVAETPHANAQIKVIEANILSAANAICGSETGFIDAATML
jgi:hypothetical protein